MLHNHGWENITNYATKRVKTQKGSARQRNPPKKSCCGSKGPFQNDDEDDDDEFRIYTHQFNY